MTKFHRLAALAAIAAIAAIPTAAASAQSTGPYSPYTPYTPGPPVVIPPPVVTPPTPDVPAAVVVAENLRDDVVDELDDVSVKNLLNKKKPATVTVAVAAAGTYTVRIERAVVTRKGKKKVTKYVTVATGSVTSGSGAAGERTIKLKVTSAGRKYLGSVKGKKVKLKLRSAFKPVTPAASTTWTGRANVTLDVK